MNRGQRGGRGRGRGQQSGVDGASASMASMSLNKAKRGPRYDVVSTRPSKEFNKVGSSGNKVMLTSNYFRFRECPDSRLNHYHVTINIETDLTKERKMIVNRIKEASSDFPAFICDGTALWTMEPAFNHKAMKEKEFASYRLKPDKSRQICHVILKLVGEVLPTDNFHIQVTTF